MFEHDEDTNALRLRDNENGYPWMSEKPSELLFCVDCYDRWLSTSEKTRWHFVPFRDKASQGNLKPTWNSQSQEKPADPQVDLPEGDVADDAPVFGTDPALPGAGGLGSQSLVETPDDRDVLLPQAESLEDVEPKVELPEMEVERPSLQEYHAKWDNLLEHHSRVNEGPFSDENLCPVPVPQSSYRP